MISKTIFVLYVTLFGGLNAMEVHETRAECESSARMMVEIMNAKEDGMKCIEYTIAE